MSDVVQNDNPENAPDTKAQEFPPLTEDTESNKNEPTISQDTSQKDQKERDSSQEKMDIDEEKDIIKSEEEKNIIESEEEKNIAKSEGNLETIDYKKQDIVEHEKENKNTESKERNDSMEEEKKVEEPEENIGRDEENIGKSKSPETSESNPEIDKDVIMEEAPVEKKEAQIETDECKEDTGNKVDSENSKSNESHDNKDTGASKDDNLEKINPEDLGKEDIGMDYTENNDTPDKTQEHVPTDITDDITGKSDKEDDITIDAEGEEKENKNQIKDDDETADDKDKENKEKKQSENDDKITDVKGKEKEEKKLTEDDDKIADDKDKEKEEKKQMEDDDKIPDDNGKTKDAVDDKEKEDDDIIIVNQDKGTDQDLIIVDTDKKQVSSAKKSRKKVEEVADTDWGKIVAEDEEVVNIESEEKNKEATGSCTSVNIRDKEEVVEVMEITDDDKNSEEKEEDASNKSKDIPIATGDNCASADTDDTCKEVSQTRMEISEATEATTSSTTSDVDLSKDTLSQDSTIADENSIFVQVNTEKDDQNDSEKCTFIEQVANEVDPIGSAEWNQNADSVENTFVSDLDEADECIIPDASKEDSATPSSSQESEASSSTSSIITTSTDSDSMRLSEKYLVSVANSTELLPCMICNQKKKYKYNCVKDNDKTTICSEECLTKLKEKHTDNVIVRKLRVKNFSTDLKGSAENESSTVTLTVPIVGNIRCKNCGTLISDVQNSLSWEAFDFCNELCLTKHQKVIGSFCANCKIEVKDNFLGKYCVRFGFNVRQFCSSTCLEQYKKSARVCSFCQKDISSKPSTFLTSIGDKGMSKDFCTSICMQKYNEISRFLKGPKLIDKCCVCHKTNTIEIEFNFRNKSNLFCSEPCFVAFKYVNDVTPEKCDMCFRYFVNTGLNDGYLIRYDGVLRKFCQRSCQNIYITTNRKIVSCCWCKVKKYNFDMIQKYNPENIVLIICSLTCLNFFNASINASKLKRKRCDFCHKICRGQYHITLADDSMKNFCSYPCVQGYQNKYIMAPARFTEPVPPPPPVIIPTTTSATSRVTRKTSSLQQRKQIIPDVPGPLPIITSVRSLAPVTPSMSTRSTRSKSSGPTIATITTLQETSGPPPVRRIVLVKPPELPIQRNMATLVKPITSDVEVEIKPIMVDKYVQTEDIKDSLVLLPVPVPIYIPQPIEMFNLSYPVPMPFPLPIPIPMFIPVTKQTANVVLKEIKKNQVRGPTDPYEADLLMMAELVAGESEKKEPAESEGEAESDGDNGAEPSFSPEPQDASNTFGDDMLQMALKMATDFDEPAVDLEGALTASTITATPGNASSEQVDDVTPITPPAERSSFRGRRRGRLPRYGGRGRKRGRPPTHPEISAPVEPEPQPPPEPVEKPDANMCLKYTFGVNAWKQWVTTKNAELEKSSRRAKLFKSDLLQLTSDELNYSLCLFVKEVRKPNGTEYAPDTIYYLCLGIQQYLFENGRIDNIFCDSYYESFTDCLDEVCKKFSTLYNDSQYIVTRVEEEHLWESKQLGAHSPHVLLSTLMFFNTKHFNLTNVDEHMQLSFSHIMKHWKRVPNQPGTPKNASSRNILLRFYPPQSAVGKSTRCVILVDKNNTFFGLEGSKSKKKVYEQQENEENPLRCPVKLYEFYLSKCPESVKTRNDVFYLLPERSCVPDSPVWYSTMALGKEALEKMLHRVKMVKEINVALLAS